MLFSCTTKLGVPKRVICKIQRSYSPCRALCSYSPCRELWMSLRSKNWEDPWSIHSIHSRGTYHCWPVTTKMTVPDIFPSTSKILFAGPSQLLPWTQQQSWSRMCKAHPPSKLNLSSSAPWPSSLAANGRNFSNCDCVELMSDIGSLKRLADKTFLKPAVQQHIAGVQSSAPQWIDCFKTFCMGLAFIGS